MEFGGSVSSLVIGKPEDAVSHMGKRVSRGSGKIQCCHLKYVLCR